MPGSVSMAVRYAERVIRGVKAVDRMVTPSKSRTIGEIVGMEIVRAIKADMRAERGPDGRPWKKIRSRFGQSGKTLQDTGRLRDSIAFLVRRNSVIVGTNVKYAATHHFGDPNRRSKRGKYLAIPQSRKIARAYRAGVSLRQQYPDAFVLKLGGSAYGYDRLWLVRKLVTGEKAAGVSYGAKGITGGKGRLEFLYLLVRRVNIPQRKIFGVSREAEAKIYTRAKVALLQTWEAA